MNNDKQTAIDKSLVVLKKFIEYPHTYTAKSISVDLGITKPTVHRILNTLEEHNFIKRNFKGEYTVGHMAYRVGMVYANYTDLLLEIRRIVDEVSVTTGEQMGYAVLEGTEVISIYESQFHDSRIRYIAGNSYPINSGCYGKVLMAYSHTQAELEEIINNIELVKVSPGAIMDKKELLEEYMKIRERGYAESMDEFLDGTVGIGVPVFKSNGEIHGCMSMGALKSRGFEDEKARFLEEMKIGANKIGQMIIE
ncbi:MAG: IclR family transcriptional regulator [Anaerovoracaceae bacterium]